MPEQNLDELFDRFRIGGPLVTPPGADAARRVHRHRHRVHVATAAALIVIAVAVPAVAYGSGLFTALPDHPVGNATTSPTQPEWTWPPSPSLSTPPTTGPTSSSTAPSSPEPPDGRFSANELGNTTLQLPPWPDYAADSCPSGKVRFRGGRAAVPGVVDRDARITEVIHVDVDRDGAEETATRIVCSGLEQTDNKVLVFDRNEAGGVVTFGQVLTESGDIAAIFAIRKSGTAVEARIVDYFTDGMPSDLMQFQWRAYSWDGDRFVQSGGPTAFPPNPKITDLSVTGPALRMTPSTGNQLSGALTITVRNNGPHPAARPRLNVTLPTQLSAVRLPAGCTTFRWARGLDLTCNLAPLGVGKDVDLAFSLTAPASVGTGTVGTYRTTVNSAPASGGGAYPEPDGKGANNVIERDIVAG